MLTRKFVHIEVVLANVWQETTKPNLYEQSNTMEKISWKIDLLLFKNKDADVYKKEKSGYSQKSENKF